MYFPFLRGKQNEFLAVIELKKLISTKKNIIPIIEPVKINNYFNRLQKAKIPFIIISNPFVGELQANEVKSEIIGNLDTPQSFYVAYQINDKTSKNGLETFLREYNKYNICLIHQGMYSNLKEYITVIKSYSNAKYHIINNSVVSSTYTENIKKHFKEVVILCDGFKKQNKNANYKPSSYFSDIMFNYRKEGFVGYSDFLIIGDSFDKGGFEPYAVVLHYTYDENTHLSVKHFVSDRKDDRKDTAGKFLESLEKLMTFLNSNPHKSTQGTIEFKDLYTRKHYPGLGFCKKVSMKHHIELLSDIV